jgi:hypothetical protein
LSSMLNSMGRALSQVLTELTEDERMMEQRRLEQAARRDQEARAAGTGAGIGRPPLRTGTGSPPQSRPLQGTTPPTGTIEAAVSAGSTPPRRRNSTSLTSQTTASSSAHAANLLPLRTCRSFATPCAFVHIAF